METEKAIPSLGNRILSNEDLGKLPDDVRSKFEIFFAEYLEMKALYETQKTNLGEQMVGFVGYYNYILADFVLNMLIPVKFIQLDFHFVTRHKEEKQWLLVMFQNVISICKFLHFFKLFF